MTKARAETRSTPASPLGLSRTKTVWSVLAVAMTVVGGLLVLSDSSPQQARALPAAARAADTPQTLDTLMSPTAAIEDGRWAGIVIHHSGDRSGSGASIAEDHRGKGLRGLGYHFVIGNGRGADDGSVHAGYRWDDQLPGAHAIGPNAEEHNLSSIAICLVGDGDSSSFTEAQLASLVALVERLQRTCDIADDRVYLHADIAPIASPGRLFPSVAFRAMLDERD